MNRKIFILTLLSPFLSLFGWKPNFLKKKEFKFDPVLISLIRKSMPNLIAYRISGIQIPQLPTGLVYKLKYKP
jgi:hypothetical protein